MFYVFWRLKSNSMIFENECKQGLVSNDRRTLSEYIHYVVDLKEQSGALKPLTVEGYRRLQKRIDRSSLGKKMLKDIRVRDLNEFYLELSKNGMNENTGGKLSPKTIREYHNLIASCLQSAAREGILINNPAT